MERACLKFQCWINNYNLQRILPVAIGKPNSSRAVANACAQNPYAPEVPCHRVIRSDGSLGGYSAEGGIERKRQLLEMEST